MSEPQTPPEGILITAALKRSRLSVRKAADAARMSDTRWRQIATGYQVVNGVKLAVKGPAEALARMAAVVDVTPEQLADAGRTDAAEELRSLFEAEPGGEREAGVSEGGQAEAIAALLRTYPPAVQKRALEIYEEQRRQAHPTPERDSGSRKRSA